MDLSIISSYDSPNALLLQVVSRAIPLPFGSLFLGNQIGISHPAGLRRFLGAGIGKEYRSAEYDQNKVVKLVHDISLSNKTWGSR